jgi:acetylornithine deacetylase/succinyl-diaminopimelate desuccinylase-like protein
MSEPLAAPAFEDGDADLLLELLRTPTVTPMETGRRSAIGTAQLLMADLAEELGFEVELHELPPAAALDAPGVPLSVLEVAERMGRTEFLSCQPSMVLRLGSGGDHERTLMLNAHLDTVGGEVPVGERDGVFSGRGAVDMKGPAVALLAAVRTALRERPDLTERVTVLLQLVAGEESGAMGSYGTRLLVERGLTGRLNVFAEPSGGVYFDSCTASMTARVRVRGRGSTDDEPEAGENATLLLGHVAVELAARLDGPAADTGCKVCVGGLATGTMHDRVYGEGSLMVNVAYPSAAAAQAMEGALEAAVRDACASFAERFAELGVASRTARAAERICHVEWVKRGLPTLAGRDPEIEHRLAAIGIDRLPESRSRERFTCDAIWGSLAPGYTIVCGPGSLRDNCAHAPDEHVHRRDLEHYARAAARLVLDFDDRAAGLPS